MIGPPFVFDLMLLVKVIFNLCVPSFTHCKYFPLYIMKNEVLWDLPHSFCLKKKFGLYMNPEIQDKEQEKR